MKIEEAISILEVEKIDIELRVSAMEQEDIEPSYSNPLLEAVNMAIEALKETRWISVEDRLPEKTGEYIVKLDGIETPAYLWYNKITQWKPFTATHWKPLPKSPEV